MHFRWNNHARRWCAWLWLAGWWLGGGGGAVGAESAGPTLEYKVKAAFLLNFARFVEWPNTATNHLVPIVIGVVGEDPFAEVLPGTVSGQTAQGRTIEIRYLGEAEPADNLAACHILFISRSIKADEQKLILDRLRGHPVLTVGEGESFVRQGGMIGFVLVDKSVRFDVNTHVAAGEKISLSSKLLNVARTVIKS